MDPARMARLGETEEPGDRPVAPGGLRLIQRFLNSHNHEFPAEVDRLGTPERAAAWLGASGLLSPGSPVTEPERLRLVALRDGLRTFVAEARAPTELSTSTMPVGVGFVADVAALVPVGDGVDRAISGLLAVVA